MKNLLLIMLLSFGLVSCKSCSKDKNTDSVIPPVTSSSSMPPSKPTNQTIQNEYFKFVLTSDWVQGGSSNKNTKSVYVNPEIETVFMVASQQFSSSYNDFILLIIRDLRDSGINISTSTPVVINGQDYIYLSTNEGSLIVHMWVTVKNGTGYQISCGAHKIDAKVLCDNIVGSFELN